MTVESSATDVYLRNPGYAVGESLFPTEQADDERSIRALTDALTQRAVFGVTVHLDYSRTKEDTRDADITLRFDGVDQQGIAYPIVELTCETLSRSFNADRMRFADPATGIHDWNTAINEIGKYGVKLENIPIRFQYDAENPDPRYLTLRVPTHIEPTNVKSRRLGNIIRDMVKNDEHPVIIDISDDPSSVEYAVQFGDGQSVLINKLALANAFGIPTDKFSSHNAAWLSRRVSNCLYEGHSRSVFIKHHGEILNPYVVSDQRTDPTDELVEAWFAIKQGEEQKQQKIKEAHRQDAIQRLNDVYASNTQSTEQLAIENDIQLSEEVDDADDEFFLYEHMRQVEEIPEFIGRNPHTGAHEYDDSSISGYDKRSKKEIKRWEKRNIDPNRPHLRRKHKQAFPKENLDPINDERGKDRPSLYDQKHTKHIKRQQINPWHRFPHPSKLDRKIERWEQKIQLSKWKEQQKIIDQKIRDSIARDKAKAQEQRWISPLYNPPKERSVSSAPILSGRKRFAVGYGSRGRQPEPDRWR